RGLIVADDGPDRHARLFEADIRRAGVMRVWLDVAVHEIRCTALLGGHNGPPSHRPSISGRQHVVARLPGYYPAAQSSTPRARRTARPATLPSTIDCASG